MAEQALEKPTGDAPSPAPTDGVASYRMSTDQLLFFTRQLASMARLNMPMAKGLRILAREVDDPGFKGLVEAVQRDLDEGVPLQDALKKHPNTFPTIFTEMLKAGEQTGNLAVILDELSSFSEASQRIKDRIKEAIMYPVVIATMISVFSIFFLAFVAPQFRSMIEGAAANAAEGSQADIPNLTRFLFFLSDLILTPLLSIPLLVGAIAVVVLVVQRFRAMGDKYDDFLFRLPIFGKLFHRSTLMKLSRTMRDLLTNGVSMVQTLRLTAATVGENRVKTKLEELLKAVEEGGSFSRNLTSGDVFPDTMVWKLQMAEEKGVIEDALKELSFEFESEVEQQTTVITKLLSPLLLFAVAIVVFLIFASIFIPLANVSAQAGG